MSNNQNNLNPEKSNETPKLGNNSVKEVIASMTLEEKAKFVVGMGFIMPGLPTNNNQKDQKKTQDNGEVSIVIEGFELPPADPDVNIIPEKVPGAAGRTHSIPRLGIPSITLADGPAGVRITPIRHGDPSKTFFATAWPVGTLLASSWDTELVKKVGAAFGKEVKEYGIDILLAPALNIHRNPLGGRNFEYYSEDPVVAGNIASAIAQGIESNGVGTSIKHYAANNQETHRICINTIVSERALREIYLRAFEIAIKKSQPWTVMSSYNKINGTYTSERHDLLTTVLRKEWGFKGFVMTDWFGGHDPIAQMNAGNDLLMPGNPEQTKAIIFAVNNGIIDIKQLDLNVERILTIILRSPTFKGYKYSDQPDLKTNAQLSRQAATEGMILLKNQNSTLPLKNTKKIALFGNASYETLAGGTGSGDVNKAYTTSLMQGLMNAGYTLEETLKKAYIQYMDDAKAKCPPRQFFFEPILLIPEFIVTDFLHQEAAEADAAILTLGRTAGELQDRKVENDFNLSDVEKELIKNVTQAFHAKGKKVIVVLNITGVIEIASWRDEPDAILVAWEPGMEAGNAIVDVLSGKVNPSGKLATTFPVNYSDVPSAKNFPGKELVQHSKKTDYSTLQGVPSEVTYEEGIYVGYRYYNTFNVKPAYEFGYGLSYTNFTYSKLKLSSDLFQEKIVATVTVTNSGRIAGKEAVQLYISAPAKKLDKPSEELKAFAKTSLLEPGASQTISFEINASDLASFDTESTAWITEEGVYTVKIGASSLDIKDKQRFTLAKDIIVEKVNKALSPETHINELKSPDRQLQETLSRQ